MAENTTQGAGVRIASSVAELIGQTPLCRLVRWVPAQSAELLGKLGTSTRAGA